MKLTITLLCIFIFGFVASNPPFAGAQNTGVLSRRREIMRVFDSDKGETLTEVMFFDPDGRVDPYFHPDLFLHRAVYSYPGQTPIRPENVIFKILPRNKYKGIVYFSIIVDNAAILEGQASLGEFPFHRRGESGPQQQDVAVPIDIFLRIAQAKKVEFKLGPKDYKNSHKLNDYERKCIVALAETMK